MDAILKFWPELVSFLVGGGLGSLITFRLTRTQVSGHGRVVDQSGAKAGGDVVAGDKTTSPGSERT